MGIRTVDQNESLDSVQEDLVYTESRLLASRRGKRFAKVVTELIDRWETVEASQRKVRRAEVAAQARVDKADDDLDDQVYQFGETLERLDSERGNKKKSARYSRYFKQPRHEIIRMGLQTELEHVREWPASIKNEPEKEVKAFATAFRNVIRSGDEALRDRGTASAKRADQRVREVLPFIDDVNATRLSVYGRLVDLASKKKLPRDWPNRFFRQSERSTPDRSHGAATAAAAGATPA